MAAGGREGGGGVDGTGGMGEGGILVLYSGLADVMVL